MAKVSEQDKKRVLDWMQKYCMGFKAARTRANILPFLRMPDRYFREVISELKHEGNIASTCTLGYWAVPLVTKDKEEVEAVIESYQEMRSKAMDLLTDTNQHIKNWQDRKLALTQQQEWFEKEKS